MRANATPHSFSLRQGWQSVDPDRFPIPDAFPFTIPHTRLLAVNHYYFKSRDDFSIKVARGNPVQIPRSMREFDDHIHQPTAEDGRLRHFEAPVQALLAKPHLRLNRPATGGIAPGRCKEALHAVNDEVHGRKADADRLRDLHVRLADISMANQMSDAPDTNVSLQVWLLRARLAVTGQAFATAEHCVRQSLLCGATSEAYALLAEILMQRRELESARFALSLARMR